MSSSASESTENQSQDEQPFDTKRLQGLLRELHADLTESINHLKTIKKQARAENSYKVQRVLKREHRDIFNTKYASIEDIVEFWMPLWQDEGRVYENGRKIRLGEEARLIDLPPEKKVDIYDLYIKMEQLFV
jgi:hypothetical protein